VIAALTLTAGSSMATTVALTTPPALPTNLTTVTLNGRTQATAIPWSPNFTITTSGTNTGWKLTVAGRLATSPVFKQYCPNTTCGSDAHGYVTGGLTLPPDSLTWNTTGTSWNSAATHQPTFQCNSTACPIDDASATKVVSALSNVSTGTWTSSGQSTLSLTTLPNLRKLPTGEVYRVDVVWTAATGP